MRIGKRILFFYIISALISVLLLAVLPSIFGANWGILYHTSCLPNSVLTSEIVWAPLVLLNSPYGGNATGTAVQSSPSGLTSSTIRAYNGSADALLSLTNWTISASTNGFILGPGSDSRCTSPYLAKMQPFNGGTATSEIIRTNATSDLGEPSVAPLDPNAAAAAAQAKFNNAYSVNDGGYFTTCGSNLGNGSYVGISGSSSSYAIQIPYVSNGNTTWINATVPTTVHYSWYFLTDGNWKMDDLSSTAGGNYGQTAFNYTPCS